jgi:hypothetical protein
MSTTFQRKCIFLLTCLIGLFQGLSAQTDGIPARPDPPRLVNILSVGNPSFLSSSEVQALEARLDEFNR